MEPIKTKMQKICEAIIEQQKYGEVNPETMKYIEAIAGGII